MRMRASAFFTSIVLAAFPIRLLAQSPVRDTSFFEFRVSDSLTFRAHGDTVWSIATGRSTRIVDSAGHISMHRLKDGVVEDTRWIVKGLTAYRTDSSSGAASLPAVVFQTYFKQIESARRFNRITRGVPPTETGKSQFLPE